MKIKAWTASFNRRTSKKWIVIRKTKPKLNSEYYEPCVLIIGENSARR